MEIILLEDTTEKILDAYSLHRGLIIDVVEQELRDSPRWPFIRSRLLRYLGESGFEGVLNRYLIPGHTFPQ